MDVWAEFWWHSAAQYSNKEENSINAYAFMSCQAPQKQLKLNGDDEMLKENVS